MSAIAQSIARISDRLFEALTREPKGTHRAPPIDEPTPAEAKASQLKAWRTYSPIIINARYHITLEPEFDANKTIATKSHLGDALQWCEYKMNQALNITLAPISRLYVWDIDAPNGTLNPIARYIISENRQTWERT